MVTQPYGSTYTRSHRHRRTLLTLNINANTSGNRNEKHIDVDRIGALAVLLSIYLCKSIDFIRSLPSQCKWPIVFQFQFLLLRSRNILSLGVSASVVVVVGCCYRLTIAAVFLSLSFFPIYWSTHTLYKTLYMRHKYLLLKSEHATKKKRKKTATTTVVYRVQ